MLKLHEEDATPPEETTTLKLPCGCVNPDALRLRVRGALSPYIEDPCLRKVVEADLVGEEPAFPLCPDPACSHHRATHADGFRSGWAWKDDYDLLKLRLFKEATRRARAGGLLVLPAAAAAVAQPTPRRATPRRAPPRPDDLLVGTRQIRAALKEAEPPVRISSADLKAAVPSIPGAKWDKDRAHPAWIVMRAAAVKRCREFARESSPEPRR